MGTALSLTGNPGAATMNNAGNDYGLSALVVLNSIIFIGFAYSFFKPVNVRDWRSFGAYSAFIVALFAEMYGFPLTIYLMSGWLGSRYPGLNVFGHDAGHLWWVVSGQQGNPHFGVPHLLSFVFLFAGFTLLSKAWHVLYHPAPAPTRQGRPIPPGASSAIHRLRGHHVRLPAAMADAIDAGDVPGDGLHVRSAGHRRGTRFGQGIRRCMARVRWNDTALHPRLFERPRCTADRQPRRALNSLPVLVPSSWVPGWPSCCPTGFGRTLCRCSSQAFLCTA